MLLFFFILIHKKKSRDSLRKGEIIRVVGECKIRSLAKGPDIICCLEKGKGGEGDKFRFCYDKIYLIPPMRLCSIIIPPPTPIETKNPSNLSPPPPFNPLGDKE